MNDPKTPGVNPPCDPIGIRLSGAGGQGLITAGVIVAEAALLEGKNVVQTQSYGPEARLGASKADVIISSAKIAYPQVTKPDVLLCLSQAAFKKYSPQVRPDTLIIIDSSNVECAGGRRSASSCTSCPSPKPR